MKPTVGRIVHYKLSAYDAAGINVRRAHFKAFQLRAIAAGAAAAEPGDEFRTGHVGHFGSDVAEGDVLPALVVRTFGGSTVNLQVHLDGNDAYWATSRVEGDGNGQWSWPEQPKHEPGDRPPRY